MADPKALKIGTLLENRFSIVQFLGAGAMGSVYKAEDLTLKRMVAVKLLHLQAEEPDDSAKAIARLHREGQALSMLKHENILAIYRIGSLDQMPFLVMELIEGKELRSIISGPMVWPRALAIALQICDALKTAHQSGVVHRDLKPENILISSSGEKEIVKLADFGLCRIVTGSVEDQLEHTKSGALIGTICYMAPEISSAKVIGPEADIYSFGCILHELLTGSVPFEADGSLAVILKHCHEPAPSLSQKCPGYPWPKDLQSAVQNCLEKSPEKRPNASNIYDRLKLILQSAADDVEIKAPSGMDSSHRNRNTSRVVLLSIFCTFLFFLTLSFFLARAAQESGKKESASTAQMNQAAIRKIVRTCELPWSDIAVDEIERRYKQLVTAKESATRINDPQGLALVNERLASYYCYKKAHSDAVKLYEEWIELNREHNYFISTTRYFALTMMNYGCELGELGRYNEAENALKDVITNSSSNLSHYEIFVVQRLLARLYFKTHREKEALRTLDSAWAREETVGADDSTRSSITGVVGTLLEFKQKEKAHWFLERYRLLLLNHSKTATVAENLYQTGIDLSESANDLGEAKVFRKLKENSEE